MGCIIIGFGCWRRPSDQLWFPYSTHLLDCPVWRHFHSLAVLQLDEPVDTLRHVGCYDPKRGTIDVDSQAAIELWQANYPQSVTNLEVQERQDRKWICGDIAKNLALGRPQNKKDSHPNLYSGSALTDKSLRLYFWKVCVISPLSTMDSDIIIHVPEFILFMEWLEFMEITSEGLQVCVDG